MVIQRWQSVLLLIAGLLMGAFTFLSLGQIQLPEYTLNFTTLGFYIEGEAAKGAATGFVARTWIFFIISLLSAIIPLVDIFLYRNLRLQKNLCLMEILFLLAVVAVGCAYGYNTIPGGEIGWSSLIIAPLLAFISVVAAYYRISSDQKLLRAADRIR